MSMAPLDLDFQHRTAPRWRWAAWLALALTAGLSAWLAQRHGELQNRLEGLQARNEAMQARVRSAQPAQNTALSPETVKRVQRANVVIQRLTLPWEALFAAVEAADSRQLALLTLEPNARELTVRLTGEAASVDDVLAYIDRLAQQPVLADVHLVSFDTAQRDGAVVVVFALSARWLSP